MIVKNEEKFIAQCLSSVEELVDEMIIVDTGSTDNTIQICKQFNAKVLEIPWENNFSAARNYGIQQAQGNWILWLDADEELEQKELAPLYPFFNNPKYKLLNVQLINYYGDHVDENQTISIGQPRFFRNEGHIKFNNAIHEALEINGVRDYAEQLKLTGELPIKLFHYGYLDEIIESRNKHERNIELLKKELEEDSNPWTPYHIAVEYYRMKDYEKAMQYVNDSILLFLVSQQLPHSMVYKLKYSIFITIGATDKAWPGINKAIQMYPDYVDLHFYKAMILYSSTEFKDALASFKQCIKLGENNRKYLITKGLGSFQAWYYKGRCLEQLGEVDEAIQAYHEALTLHPGYTSAQERITALEQKQDSQEVHDTVPSALPYEKEQTETSQQQMN